MRADWRWGGRRIKGGWGHKEPGLGPEAHSMNERGWAGTRPGGESGEERLLSAEAGRVGKGARGKLRGENGENFMNACD